MKLQDLLKKINKLNELNDEIGTEDRKYFIVVEEKFSQPIYVYTKKDFKKLEEYYIKDIYNNIISSELVQDEKFTYNVPHTEIKIQIGLN